MKFASIIIFASLIPLSINAATLKCDSKAERQVKKIHKKCDKKDAPEICHSISKSSCEDTLSSLSMAIQLNGEKIQNLIISEDFSKPEVKEQISKEIKSLKKFARLSDDPAEEKRFVREIDKMMSSFKKLEKKDADFFTKVHPNGLTTRQIAKKLLESDTKLKLAQAVSRAKDKYLKLKKEDQKNFTELVRDEFANDSLVSSVLPFSKKDGRNVASVGLILYGCASPYIDEPDFHVLIAGKKMCEGDGAEFKELVFGPGLYVSSGSKVTAAVCLSGDNGFTGVGVSAGVAALFGAEVGVFVGTGVCTKIEISLLGIGAYAGVSYLKIEPDYRGGLNVFGELFDNMFGN